MKLRNGEFIFVKFWYFPTITKYKITPLPGGKDGISGSCIGGLNIGINSYISDEKKNAAIHAIEYINSKEFQKKMIMDFRICSAISSLYDDEEVCAKVNCNFFKTLQLIQRPKEANYDTYSEKFRNYIYEFLYGSEKSANKVLNKINDIKKIYYISIKTDDTYVGLLFFIICIVLSVLMLLSLFYLMNKKKMDHFKFLPKDFWILNIIGFVTILNICFFGYGKSYPLKCNFLFLTLILGFTLTQVPLLYILASNYPEINKISEWIKYHRYYFLFIFIFFDLLAFLLIFFVPYGVETKIIDEGKNFQICLMKNQIGNMIINITLFCKFLLICLTSFLIFIEWNIKETYYDIRFLVSAIYMDILLFVLFVVISNIKIDNYISSFVWYNILYISISCVNYSFIYGYRIVYELIKINNEEEIFIKQLQENFKDDEDIDVSATYASKNYNNISVNTLNQEIFNNKLLNYHYRVSVISSNNSSSLQINENAEKNSLKTTPHPP